MTRPAAVGILVLTLGASVAAPGNAQPRSSPASSPTSTGRAAAASGLRAHFGTDIATRLLRSGDADERVRGMARLAAIHTPEALALLERTAGAAVPGAVDTRAPLDGVARTDPRALLVAVRGLAGWLDGDRARSALASIVSAPTQSFATRPTAAISGDPSADDTDGAARVVLARQEAAVALAASGNAVAIEALIAIARAAGPGQAPALDALAIHPPAAPLLGGVVLTTPETVALAIEVGDLRSLDAIEAAMKASDPALRSAALFALGIAGDSRIVEGARGGLRDSDPRVRVAAGDALVRLGAPDAPQAIEGLITDDATAIDGLRLAQFVQGEGVTKAAAARAAATGVEDVRAAALAALGRQTSPLAIGALAALVTQPTMQGDAACAMARSPSRAAMGAIEAMAAVASTRRVAGRAYLVRRLVRMERSSRLDALVDALAASDDAVDRAVGVQALVSLGERPIARGLDDADPGVRRAAAMGALAGDGRNRSALLARMGVEPDPATRQVFALGLLDGDADRVVSTFDLADRAQAGGPDAPLAALALAERFDEHQAVDIDAMLASHDPVLRGHVARGLGASASSEAVGRLAHAYAIEGDVVVRRAIVAALATRTADASSPSRRGTLELAATLDPDRIVRWTASRALSDATTERRSLVSEVAWLRLTPAPGATVPRDMTAALVGSDGIARPIAFDDDGYALVPGMPPGEARLRLAPRLPPYEAPPP